VPTSLCRLNAVEINTHTKTALNGFDFDVFWHLISLAFRFYRRQGVAAANFLNHRNDYLDRIT
jgi:hypothetical protein